MHLDFKDSYSSFIIDTSSFLQLSLTEQIKVLIDVQDKIESIGEKGYLASLDLTTYPGVSELLPYFVNQGKDLIEYINGEKSMESYK
jgi:hypothetical protein